MRRYIWTVVLAGAAAAGVWGADAKHPASKGDARAAALLRDAASTRYTWSADVTAVSGKIAWDQDGNKGRGTFRSALHQRGGFTITAEGDGSVPAEVKEHVASMIGHRVPPRPGTANRPQPPSVIVVEDEERGPLILTVGDPMQSTQRVRDRKLVQVNRVMGGKRFTIDVTEFETASDHHRVYPAAFTVTWWDAKTGKKLERQTYTTLGFYQVDGQMFPRAEKVVSEKDGKTSVLEVRYSDVKFERSQPRAAAK